MDSHQSLPTHHAESSGTASRLSERTSLSDWRSSAWVNDADVASFHALKKGMKAALPNAPAE